MTDETTSWTPDQPLRAGADWHSVAQRAAVLWETGGYNAAMRELAAAEVAAYRERVLAVFAFASAVGSEEYCEGYMKAVDHLEDAVARVPLTPEAP